MECHKARTIEDRITGVEVITNPKRRKYDTFMEFRRAMRDERARESRISVWEKSPEPHVYHDKYEDSRRSDTDDNRQSRRKRKKEKKNKKKKKSRRRRSPSSSSSSSSSEDDQGQWVEKVIQIPTKIDTIHDDDAIIGPTPLILPDAKVDYGGDISRSEAEAMSKYVQDNMRIPRRGEIGLNPDEISKFEDAGFVMSGSRNKRMTAVRVKKESQVCRIYVVI
ncbi:NKAP-like protein-like [Planoprotostelium fungivorum]|uniref:NKAP-like protein-like n=1 Tax=Planoprotostelium fungivorum TaxID=1890364 RepID=A0A2P6N9V7_9EUKA|nr:NKAP-like protein-like [Planoprotostelium fungivorum]